MLQKLNKPWIRVVLGLILISLSAQCTIPVTEDLGVPISAQSLVIITWAMLEERRTAMVTLFLYLLMGAVGLPVWAEGGSGISKLYGPTAGYLWGFLLAATWAAGEGKKAARWSILWYQISATMILLSCGYLVLALHVNNAWQVGVQPFLPGAIIKVIIGTSFIMGWNKWKTGFR